MVKQTRMASLDQYRYSAIPSFSLPAQPTATLDYHLIYSWVVHASSRINAMFTWSNFGRIHATRIESLSPGGVLYFEHNYTTIAAISEMLMKLSQDWVKFPCNLHDTQRLEISAIIPDFTPRRWNLGLTRESPTPNIEYKCHDFLQLTFVCSRVPVARLLESDHQR